MTTAPDRHEPLDPEERDLAARLGRLGPFEGPSPALDARILAAAHAAASAHSHRRRRRLPWLGMPPVLITGAGVAAAAVLALGLVWQLRPQYGGVITRQEAGPGDEMIIMVDPPAGAAQSAGRSVPEAPAPTDSPLRKQRTTPAAVVAAKPAAKMRAGAPAPAAAPAPPPAAMAGAGAPVAGVEPEEEHVADAVAEDAASGFVAEPPGTSSSPSMRKSHATYTTAARAAAERRERAAADAAAAAAPQDGSQAESTTLDRIEVTGSRMMAADIDWSQVPVSDDTGLAPAEWLERIRARRDAGDADPARASLELFKREHPRVRIPDDLRALLTADAPR